jgi:hypothetical protein
MANAQKNQSARSYSNAKSKTTVAADLSFVCKVDISQIFNSLEMSIWLVVGVAFFANGFRQNNRYKKLTFLLAAAYIAFGLSDGVEIHTGAWWQPWWLLLWKVLCVVIFVISLIYYIWNERRLKNPLNPPN